MVKTNTEELKDLLSDTIVTNYAPLEQVLMLREMVNKEAADYKQKANKNRIGATLLQTVLILFSNATTIFIGWQLGGADATKTAATMNWALVFSAVTTGVSMFYNFFDYKELWVQFRVASNQMKAIGYRIDYLESRGKGKVTQEELNKLYHQFDEICSRMNNYYNQVRSAKDGTNENPK